MELNGRLGTAPAPAVSVDDCVLWAQQQVGPESGHQGQQS